MPPGDNDYMPVVVLIVDLQREIVEIVEAEPLDSNVGYDDG